MNAQYEGWYIEGPDVICGLPINETYTLFDAEGNQVQQGTSNFPFWISWQAYYSATDYEFNAGNPINFIGLDEAYPTFLLTAKEGSPYTGVIATLEISYYPDLFDLNVTGTCAEDEETNCQQVCIGKTTDFSLSESGGIYNWSIQGSEDYEINGNTASVTWNEVGEGSVVVEQTSENLLFCNAVRWNENYTRIFLDGDYQLPLTSVIEDNPEINITISPSTNSGLYANYTEIEGTVLNVTDANGRQTQCTIPVSIQNDYHTTPTSTCDYSFYISDVVSPTVCQPCNGSIQLNTSADYFNITWEDGFVGGFRDNLCPGTYLITGTSIDASCVITREITLSGGYCDGYTDYYNFNANFKNAVSWFAEFEGGTPPYSITITDDTGETYEYPNTFSLIEGEVITGTIGPLNPGPGIFTFEMTDAVGHSTTHTLTAPAGDGFQYSPYIIDSPSDCIPNNGRVYFQEVNSLLVEIYIASVPYNVPNNQFNNLSSGTYEFRVYPGGDPSGDYDTYIITLGDNCTETTACPPIETQCVQVLPNPEAQFITLPAAQNDTVEVCSNQTINFQNQSIGAESFIWQFGDFNTSVTANPEHTYANPGTYEVSCIARNDCYCSDTTTLVVKVLDIETPEIECLGTVCAGDTVTYSTAIDFDLFDWNIIGGDIIDGGNSDEAFITIVWGDEAAGEISLSASVIGNPSFCPTANTIEIPILSGNAQIEGPAQVCNGEQVLYSIPKYDGTEFVWTISEFGTITSGENTHQITVNWQADLPTELQSVEVEYFNCWLECGGNAQKDVAIVPEFYITGEPLVCESESTIFYGKETANGLPVNLNWQLENTIGEVVYNSPLPAASVLIPFVYGSGEFTLHASPANINDFCTNTYELKIQVAPLPDAPVNIFGQNQICLGESYNYSAISDLSDVTFNWLINDSGNISTQSGNTAVVTWTGNGTHTISVSQTAGQGLDCTSESISLTVVEAPNPTFSGINEICAESTVSYSATDIQGIDYQWSINPPNAGTIISGDNSSNIEVYWAYAGVASVNLQVCSENLSENVIIHPLPNPQVNHPDNLCPDATTIVSTNQNYASYLWKDANGTTISAESSPELTSGYYEIEVISTNSCIGNSIFSIGDFTTNELNISTPDFRGICPAAGVGFPTLYAPTLETGFVYEWFLNDISLGINTIELPTTDYGDYTLQATNSDGCTINSNTITVYNNCGTGNPGPGPTFTCNLNFSINNAGDCKTFEFTPTSNNIISIIAWDFGDDTPQSTEENPIHTYAEVGLYNVVLFATVADDDGNPVNCISSQSINFPISANFGFSSECASEAIQFGDISLTVGGGNIVTHAWDFGDPTSGDNTSSEQNPSHLFSSSGSYTVSLTTTDETGCTDTKTKDVTVLAVPSVSFSPPEQACAETALPFTATVSETIVNFNWNFGEPNSGNANFAQSANVWHNYSTPNNYEITLTGSDIYGCIDIETQSITTEPNSLTGDIAVSPANTICQGSTVQLTAPTGGTSWTWSTGETSENITVNEAGSYSLTLTDANTCTYIPAAQVIEVLPLPQGDIYATELDEFGNPINYIFEEYAVCVGEDVFLQIEENELYGYEWSTGSTTINEEFSEDRDNILEEGEYDIAVTITDNLTGCTSISSYSVIVHGAPEDIVIESNVGSPICGNTAAILSITNPSDTLTYIWNTGEVSPSISLIAGGEYWVKAYNSFGCEGESNRIAVENAPDINKIPDGCHSVCVADSILCLPDIPNIAVYQWYLNGEIMTSESSNSPDLVMTESGEYQLFMEDIYGCTSLSDPLNVEFYNSPSAIFGQVFLDVNENGIIDNADAVLSDINIQIFDQAGVLINTSTTATELDNFYLFSNILTTDYNLVLDTLSLPSDVTYTIFENFVDLEGCSDEETLNWLVIPYCTPILEDLNIIACDGNSVIYENEEILIGESMQFFYNSIENCDSILTVTVIDFTPEEYSQTELICTGTTIEIHGQTASIGDILEITLSNEDGCDSTVTYTVLAGESETINQTSYICEGESMQINGQTINAGETVELQYTNQNSCDSIIILSVESLPPDFTAEITTICNGDIFLFQNIEMTVGDTETFTLSNQYNCDSIVEMTVNAFPPITFNPQSQLACPGLDDGSLIIENMEGTPPFNYSIDGENWQTEAEFNNLYAGSYLVQIRDANNCISEENITLQETPALDLLAENQILECGENDLDLEYILVGGNGSEINYLWNTGDTTANLNISQVGDYSLTVSDECSEQSVVIPVIRASDNRANVFYLPNAFSPNLDGINDKFCTFSGEDIEILSFRLIIFDRWGNFVFESNNPENCWDGTIRNKPFDPAVFVYALEAEVLICERSRSILEYGDVTITK